LKKKQKNYNQKFKIFGRKKGRKSLQSISTETFDKYLVNLTTDFISKKIILDIGSGNGESTLFLSRKYPNNLIIASEIYQDGNTNLCQELHRNEIDNVKIFNQNVLILFEEFKLDNLIKEIWILFPDPWPKKKHSKRRLINSSFIEKVFYLLEENGKIYIVTDNSSYFISILKTFYLSRLFKWNNDLPDKWDYNIYFGYKTKYFKKALRNKKKSFIIIFQKI